VARVTGEYRAENGGIVSHKIGVVPGDGIGPEVIAESLKVLRAAGLDAEFVEYDLGGNRFLATGEVLPDSVLQEWRDLDAILLGAVGHPDVAPGILERGLLLRARFALDLYVNLRPVKLLPGIEGALRDRTASDIDFLVVRENTEGLYSGAGGSLRGGCEDEIAIENSLNTATGARRCIEYAFGLAEKRSARELCLVHKTNVLLHAGGLWARIFDEVAQDHPAVKTWYCHVDAACLHMVLDPGRFDVIVTDNLFGDIVTDLGAAISGGLGFAASGNINPSRDVPSIFEPVHGSAPDIAGTGKANPIAAILSAAMMLDVLEEEATAMRVRKAVEAFLESNRVRPDGTFMMSTSEVGDIIAAALD
jgi:3-isopropylmalate dehydrogenase